MATKLQAAPSAAVEAVHKMDYGQQLERKEVVKARLGELSSNGNEEVQSILTKKDTHWDFVMKEMSWLANDFQKERLRHKANAKKLTKAVDMYHKTKEAKKLKKSKDEVVNIRKVSSRLSRDVRKFWLKINKVVAFKQKMDADEVRQKAMDKHLVFLVKQTERYTNMLAENMMGGEEDDDVSVRSGSTNASAASSQRRSPREGTEVPRGAGAGEGQEGHTSNEIEDNSVSVNGQARGEREERERE
eukprot:CAMPEP_0173281656 /NCGR_PEP_ID=MMETSP1143-20121109/6362_1 /TAXON_ID=483371 /ORGANISM="non described non described, Strain CCMP2298" /LENGTH=244 /DNA_ID=CAMNT_0014219093 /DNA_START=63 /DNA_END=794 /DNA_ORIENTATION=-